MKTRVEESQQSTSADYDEPSVAEVEEPVDCPGATHCLPNISASVSNLVSILTLIAFVKPGYARLRNIIGTNVMYFSKFTTNGLLQFVGYKYTACEDMGKIPQGVRMNRTDGLLCIRFLF